MSGRSKNIIIGILVFLNILTVLFFLLGPVKACQKYEHVWGERNGDKNAVCYSQCVEYEWQWRVSKKAFLKRTGCIPE